MKSLKKQLIKIANQNKKTDLAENLEYWVDVISEINKADDFQLLKIAQIDFGYETIKELLSIE
jgi:hypothetical protein